VVLEVVGLVGDGLEPDLTAHPERPDDIPDEQERIGRGPGGERLPVLVAGR
jgi:hypothetical protein